MQTGTSKMSRTAWGLDTMPDGEWLKQAACGPNTAHLFDVLGSKGISEQTLTAANEQAVAICLRCPVRVDCLDDALAHPIDWWFIAGGEVVHRGQIVPARPAHTRGRPPAHPVSVRSVVVRPIGAADPDPAGFADAVGDLLGLGWSVQRIASALGIGVTAVRRHAPAARP